MLTPSAKSALLASFVSDEETEVWRVSDWSTITVLLLLLKPTKRTGERCNYRHLSFRQTLPINKTQT